MKAKRDHRVPLSGRAIEILHDARRRSDGTGLLFRSPRGKPTSPEAGHFILSGQLQFRTVSTGSLGMVQWLRLSTITIDRKIADRDYQIECI